MINDNHKHGLSYKQIRRVITDELDKNSDILMGIDDPEMQEMINLLVDAVSKAISINNEQISEDLQP